MQGFRRTTSSRALRVVVAGALAALAVGAAPVARAAPVHTDASNATSSDGAQTQTDAAASRQAQTTGTAVPIPADTTPTNTVTANPDGSFTLDQYVEPIRKRVAGAWKPLDDTLLHNGDGTVSPAVSTNQVTLSGGGSGPLAVLKTGGHSLGLTLPVSLPTPALSGDTATYADVISGVDLKVMVDKQGGFSDVLVVKNATAAADPRLASLTSFTAQTTGVDLSTDSAGNITAKDSAGRTDFFAPAPLMWDSATPSTQATSSVKTASADTGTGGDSGEPVDSSPSAPGVAAHVASVDSSYAGGAITLTPDASLLTGPSTVYPLYIDPSYGAGGTLQAWTYVDSYYSTTSFWKSTDSAGLRVGYQGWDAPYYVGRTYAQMSVDSRLYGADIQDSHFYATDIYAPSCTAEPVELWAVNQISSATTWANQPDWVTKLDTQNVAYGWSSDCAPASIGFDTKPDLVTAAAKSWPNVTLGLKATDETDRYGWKKFDHATMHMETHYDHRPNNPTSPHTSPSTNCTGTVTTVGNGDVSLYAYVSDPDGGALQATFKAWETNSPSVTVQSGTLSATSGTTPSLVLHKATLDSKAGSSQLQISWNVTVSDGTLSSKSPSTTCTFNFDPTIPGPPSITDSTGADCGDSTSTAAYTVGTSATFTITPAAGGGTPSGYLYQLNGAAPITTTKTTFTIKPPRQTDILTVTALSPGGNIGDTAACTITAAAPATAADGDLTGDGIADLITVGHKAGLAPGLWLARGQAGSGHTQGDGQVLATGVNIGSAGTGVNTHGTASDYNGTQAITGHFATGSGFNDVLDYDPSTGAAHILFGSGDGSPLIPVSGSEGNVSSDFFTDPTTGAHAAQVASGGSLYNKANGYDITGFPDLLFILEGHLYLEAAFPTPGAFGGIDSALDLGPDPTGTGDWTGWTITTSLINGLPAMFASSPDGGSMYYYTPANMLDLAVGNTTTPVKTNMGWGVNPLLQAADINTDGTPDLWGLDPDNGEAFATYFDGQQFANSSQPGQQIVADSHNWVLNDSTSGSATTAADNANTALSLTGSGTGPRWDDGDLFNPHLNLDGTSSGVMTTNAALTTSGNFSVSVWAKPAAYGGAVLSQDGSNVSGFAVVADSGSKTWYFCMAQADTTATARDCAHGGPVRLGVWTHITATYNASTKRMALYVDGIESNESSHTAVTGFTGHFTVGRQKLGGNNQSYFNGALANAEVWAGTTLAPDQVAALSETPGYVVFPSDDTNYTSGSAWSTAGAKMTFNSGQLTITETAGCTSGCTWSQGSTGHASAVLTFQSDNNLVIYTGSAHTLSTSLWATNTFNTIGNATLFLQPDGNLVIYDADGTVLWYSGTVN